MFECNGLSAIGEGDPAGIKQGGIPVIPGAVFVVAYQRETPAGKLDPDLMAAAGMEPDVDQGFFSFG